MRGRDFFIVVLCTSVLLSAQVLAQQSDAGGFWVQFPLRQLKFPHPVKNATATWPFFLEVLNSSSPGQEVCIYDPVPVHWSMASPFSHDIEGVAVTADECSVAFRMTADDRDTAPGLVTAAPLLRSFATLSSVRPVLRCLLDSEHCALEILEVKVDSSRASTTDTDRDRDDTRTIEVTFSAATTQPAVLTAEELTAVLLFSPPLRGPVAGEWLAEDVLRISVRVKCITLSFLLSLCVYLCVSVCVSVCVQASEQYVESLVASSASGAVSVTLRTDTLSGSSSPIAEEGLFTLRLPRPGTYQVFVLHSATKRVMSSVHLVSASLCGDSIVPADLSLLSRQHGARDTTETPPRPLLRHSGVIAVSGKHPLLVPHAELPSSGTFSVSLWLRLLSSPEGFFRAFFYKGDGTSPNRTPSAWLLPTANRLAVRATTADTPDLGADSTLTLPLNQWAHVCVVFDNRSSASAGGYKVVVYVDGQLDISIGYSTEVIPNNGSLQFFKDVSHDGPRSLVADLVLWDGVLSEEQVKTLASTSAGADHHRWTRPADLALDLMEGLRAGDKATAAPEEESGFDLLLGTLPPQESWTAASAQLDLLLGDIAVALENCAPPVKRLDLYAEAAALGQ